MKKSWLIGLLSLLTVPFALADVGSTLSNVWWKILSIGNLSFLGLSDGSAVVAFTRILIGIFVFTVIFAVLAAFRGGKDKSVLGFLNKGQAGVVAAIIAIITAIFLPASVLLATGTGWAVVVALLLIGGPIVGIAYIVWNLTDWINDGKETRGTVFLKMVLCLLLFWVLSAMKYHVGKMGVF